MIKHVVMWRLKDVAEGNKKSVNQEHIIKSLIRLKSSIQEIDSLEVGENFNPSEAAFDLVLITSHKNKAALKAYVDHPVHKDAATFIEKVIKDRTVVDFEY